MNESEIRESSRLFARAWEFWARRHESGEVSQLPGLKVAWMNVAWPICNLTFLSEPVDAAGLESAAQAALDYAQERDRGWLLFACQDFLPERARQPAEEILSRHGMAQVGAVTGMAAERLLPPRRPLPDLEIRAVSDEETRRDYCAVNALAYEEPDELVREALGPEKLWGEGTFGCVGYLDGQPVCTAKTIALDGVLYMALVATRPDLQKKGYAEAVMRHSLARAREATGLERTFLHATPAGLALYQEMGYRGITEFLCFAAGGDH